MFVEEYLQELRGDRFTLRAFVRYGRRVAARIKEHWYANPGAVRSIWITALGFYAAAFLAAVALALGHDRELAYRFFLHTALWIFGAFAIITLHVEHLCDRDGYPLSALNVPTILTLLRVILVPGIALFLLDRHLTLALGVFLVAAFSDVVDGWIARRWRQETRLGRVLDPMVDVVFNLAVFFALAAASLMPAWVFALAALRYGLLLVGGTALFLFVGPPRVRPTSFGRATGVAMTTLIVLLAALHALRGRVAEILVPLTEIALGVLLAATVIHVILLGWYNFRLITGTDAAARGRVVGDVRWGAQ